MSTTDMKIIGIRGLHLTSEGDQMHIRAGEEKSGCWGVVLSSSSRDVPLVPLAAEKTATVSEAARRLQPLRGG